MSTSGSGGPGPVQSPSPTSALGVVALILAFLVSPLGLILGLVALARSGRTSQPSSERGLAIVATVISVVGTLILAGAVVLYLRAPQLIPPPTAEQQTDQSLGDVFNAARASAGKVACLSNLKNIAMAAQMWAEEHGGKLPAADRWVDDLLPYGLRADTLKCPTDTSDARSSFAMNAALSGVDVKAIPDPARVVLFYETAHPGNCPAGGPQDVAASRHPSRGENGSNYAFADGRARWVGAGEPASFAVK